MRFIKNALKQLPFFQHLKDTDTIFYEVIFSCVTSKWNQGDTLIKKGEKIDNIYIVEQGIVEVSVMISGKPIVLERLFRGSVINFKTIFRAAQSQVTMTFAVESVIKKLSTDAIKYLRDKNSKIDRIINKFEMKMARIPIIDPLDYILVLPKKVYTIMIERTREKMLFSKQAELMKEL